MADRDAGVTASVSGQKTQTGIFDGDSGATGDNLIAGAIGFNSGDDFGGNTYSHIEGQITLATSSTITFRQWVWSAEGTPLLGVAASTGIGEVYASLEIWKLD